MSNAIVYKSTGSHYTIKDEQGKFWVARLRGRLKIDKEIRSSNPIAVGDNVDFEIENEDASLAIITDISPRYNYIVRVSPKNRNQKHIVAANVDQAIMIGTLASPKTSLGFIDRFLITAEAYHIPAIIVFNKKDILDDKQLQEWSAVDTMYRQIGYPSYLISAETDDDFDILPRLVKDKKTLLTGHSGVGKSTIINKLQSHQKQKIQDVSNWSGRGKHTTTFAEMMDLPEGGMIIDTPGLKEFGIIDITKEELSHYFVEMRNRLNDCKFNNCMHLEEPGCAIKSAVSNGDVHPERYYSYLSILETIMN